MKKIDIDFYSYRPRLRVDLTWTADSVPNIGDEIIIGSKFISELDTKYFPKWRKDYPMIFKVKKRLWNLDEKNHPLTEYDVRLELDWTDEEQKKVDKYVKSKIFKN